MTATHATETRDALFARIDAILDHANGKRYAVHHLDGDPTNNDLANLRMLQWSVGRRTHILSRDEVLALVSIVRDGAPFAFAHAGTVANAYTQPAVTTFALAARVDGVIHLGITTADAKGRPTPGRGWKALQPWSEDGPRGNADHKWAMWTNSPNVISIGAGEIDAMIEAEGL